MSKIHSSSLSILVHSQDNNPNRSDYDFCVTYSIVDYRELYCFSLYRDRQIIEEINFVYYNPEIQNLYNAFIKLIHTAIQHDARSVMIPIEKLPSVATGEFLNRFIPILWNEFNEYNLKIIMQVPSGEMNNAGSYSRRNTDFGDMLASFVNPEKKHVVSFRQWFDKTLKTYDCTNECNRIVSRSVYNDMKDNNYMPSKETLLTVILHCGFSKNQAMRILHKYGYHLSDYFEYDTIILKAIEESLDVDQTNQKLLEVHEPSAFSHDPLESHRYRKQLLGSDKVKKCAMLQVQKKYLNPDEYKRMKRINGCIE